MSYLGVRQGYVGSPWLFNLFMDNCLTELLASDRGLRIGEFIIKRLWYTDDQVLFALFAKDLQEMMNIMYGSFKRNGIIVNVDKTKVMGFETNDILKECVTEIDIVKLNR